MIRLAAFFLGLALVLAAWPQVQLHHVKAEMMQLAWCSSGGSAAASTSFFTLHCIWCPALMAGLASMIAAPFLGRVRPAMRALKEPAR